MKEDEDSNNFNINKYLKNIKSKIIKILKRPSKYSYIPDILDDEDDIRDKLISLRVKQKEMKYGEIWQTVIGEYQHFQDLGKKHTTGLDVISNHRKLIIELKNRYNTDNHSSRKTNFDKLAKFKIDNSKFQCIYGIINDKTLEGNIKEIEHNNICIKYYSGNQLFRLIFGDNKDIIIRHMKKVIKEFTMSIQKSRPISIP